MPLNKEFYSQHFSGNHITAGDNGTDCSSPYHYECPKCSKEETKYPLYFKNKLSYGIENFKQMSEDKGICICVEYSGSYELYNDIPDDKAESITEEEFLKILNNFIEFIKK